MLRAEARWYRGVSLLLLLTYVAACHGWKTQPGSPQEILDKNHPRSIRVTRTDESRIELASPALQGDTLTGWQKKPERDAQGWRKTAAAILAESTLVAVPVDSIREIAVSKTDVLKTVALTAGIGLTVLAIVAAAGCCGPDFRPNPNDSLKSSPLVYSWDGHQWRLDSGTFAGAITQAAARTDVDNLIYAAPEGPTLRLRLTNELKETDYVDELRLIVVDHDSAIGVAPGPNGRLHTVGKRIAPVRATDFAGRDALAAVGAEDNAGWESVVLGRSPERSSDIRDGLDLAFPLHGAKHARLVIDAQNTPWVPAMLTDFVTLHGRTTEAWYDSLNSRPEQLRTLGEMMAREGFLQVLTRSEGEWRHQGMIGAPGPELAKRQVLPLDLSGITDDTARVRLASAPAFWWVDHVALDTTPERPFAVQSLLPVKAADESGRDVLPLLRGVDRRYYVIETGHGADLRFELPPAPSAGVSRSFLVQSTGWYRIRTEAEGEPETALLDSLLTVPGAASRYTVDQMNRLIHAIQVSDKLSQSR